MESTPKDSRITATVKQIGKKTHRSEKLLRGSKTND